jgi:hypothetical protein
MFGPIVTGTGPVASCIRCRRLIPIDPELPHVQRARPRRSKEIPLPETIQFRVTKTQATCAACNAVIPAGDKNQAGQIVFALSPHLREKHGFSDAVPHFETVGKVICPPMEIVEASNG